MKKWIALVLVMTTILSVSAVALAETTTTLSTTVPAATYTLVVPADQNIPFGAGVINKSANEENVGYKLGSFIVKDSAGFASGKNLQVTLNYEPFRCDGNSTEIPYTLGIVKDTRTSTTDSHYYEFFKIENGEAVVFYGNTTGVASSHFRRNGETDNSFYNEIHLAASSKDWGKALAGEYTSVITYVAEVVVSD